MKSLAEPENKQNVFASVQYLKSKLIEKYGEREIGFAKWQIDQMSSISKQVHLIESYTIAGIQKDAMM